jgi:hypothetical protein
LLLNVNWHPLYIIEKPLAPPLLLVFAPPPAAPILLVLAPDLAVSIIDAKMLGVDI